MFEIFFIKTISAVNRVINKMVLKQPQHHLKSYTKVYFVSNTLVRKKKNINTRYLSEEGSGSRLVHRCKCSWTGLCFPVCGDGAAAPAAAVWWQWRTLCLLAVQQFCGSDGLKLFPNECSRCPSEFTHSQSLARSQDNNKVSLTTAQKVW